MIKTQIISDKNLKSLKIKSLLTKILKKNRVKKSNFNIVIGGDGFMLQTLKKNKNSKKSFYGVNSGNYGFLMNKFSSKNIATPIVETGLLKKEPFRLPTSSLPNSSSITSFSTFFFTIVRLFFFFMNGALGQTRTGTPQAARILSPLCLPISPRGH